MTKRGRRTSKDLNLNKTAAVDIGGNVVDLFHNMRAILKRNEYI